MDNKIINIEEKRDNPDNLFSSYLKDIKEYAKGLAINGTDRGEMYLNLVHFNVEKCHGVMIDDVLKSLVDMYAGTLEEYCDFKLTQMGNAERYLQKYKNDIRYDWTSQKWLMWDGRRWNLERGQPQATKYGMKVSREITNEITQNTPGEMKKKLAVWSARSERHSEVSGTLNFVKTMIPIETYLDDYDSNHLLLNVKNGTIDLRNRTIKEHDPSDNITNLAPITYDENAKCPLWMKCLDEWHKNKKDEIEYLQRLGGYLITGETVSRAFPIFYGSGKNGKSVFLDTLMLMLGDYATVAPKTLLASNHTEEHSTELAGLVGKRLVVASETKKNMRLKTALVKSFTGDQKMTARYMRQDYFIFTPTFKVVLMTQNLPIIDETTDAIWDRVQRMKWDYRIPDNKQNPNLVKELKKEWSGILNWLIEGCKKWQEDGMLLKPTKAIIDETKEYREESLILNDFLNENCIYDKETNLYFVSKKELYYTYKEQSADKYQLSIKNFNRELKSMGYKDDRKKIEGNTTHVWYGIKLNECEKSELSNDELEGLL